MASPAHHLIFDEYLQIEQGSKQRSELVDGQLFAMAGASAEHTDICMNLSAILHGQLQGSSCKVRQSDFKVRVGENSYYPDVLVVCNHSHKYYTESPAIVCEVLSGSTEKFDRSRKLAEYLSIKHLSAYLIVDPKTQSVEVYRLTDTVEFSVFRSGDVIELVEPAVELAISGIFAGLGSRLE